MWSKVARALDELTPWLTGTGLRAGLVDVLDGEVTLSLEGPPEQLARGRAMLEQLIASTPGVRAVRFEAAGPSLAPQGRVESRPMTAEELEIHLAVARVLDEEINPGVAGHGGEVALVDVVGAEVFVEMRGGCQGCASSSQTLRQGVETTIRRAVPAVERVIDTTDHASGSAPYYA
jgi:Fe-S cluster biogenesis protein NfuA